MKNIYKLLFAFMVIGFMSSCEENLELLPTNEVAVEIALETPDDFENAAKGIYSAFRRSGYYGATSGAPSIYFIPDVISDNTIINANGRRSREQFYDWRYDEDDSSEVFWLSAYKVIQRANLLLENTSKLASAETKDRIEGEALAARGMAMFDLAKFYCDAPQGNGGSLGLPIVTSTDASLKPARSTVSETYAAIIADLNSARTKLAGVSRANIGRIDESVVLAALNRVHTFSNDWPAVISTGTALLALSPSMASIESFPGIWNDNNSEGVIWKLLITQPDNVEIGVAWLQESPDGIRSEFNVDYSLYTQYDTTDVRYQWFETSPFSEVDYNHVIKYRGRETGNANLVDAKIFRTAEVFLSLAEAYSESSDDGKALEMLNMVKSNRYPEFMSGGESGADLKTEISKQRRLELAFEGDRFFYLKRKGLPIQRSEFGDKADGSGEPAEFKTLEAGDHRFNMAIGLGEISANDAMEQNPGY